MKNKTERELKKDLLFLMESLKNASVACESVIAKLCDACGANTTSLFLPCPICGNIPSFEVEKGKVSCKNGHFGVIMVGYDFSEKETLETLAKEWNKFASTGKIDK